MEIITRETFNNWAIENNWLFIAKVATANGEQSNYVTPSGSICIAMYDLKGQLQSIGQPMPQPPPQAPPMRQGPPPFFGGKGNPFSGS